MSFCPLESSIHRASLHGFGVTDLTCQGLHCLTASSKRSCVNCKHWAYLCKPGFWLYSFESVHSRITAQALLAYMMYCSSCKKNYPMGFSCLLTKLFHDPPWPCPLLLQFPGATVKDCRTSPVVQVHGSGSHEPKGLEVQSIWWMEWT